MDRGRSTPWNGVPRYLDALAEQFSKMCMIDDYLVAGVNGSCSIFSYLDWHDTFIALVHR